MLEVLSAFLIAQAGSCAIALEQQDGWTRLRPACAVTRERTQEVVSDVLSKSDTQARIAFGRLVHYSWLSDALASQASSSRHWQPGAGKDNAYVRAALAGMPEFTGLFRGWRISNISVEKVLVKRAAELSLPAGAPVSPNARLPYDALLWVTLER